MVGIAKLSSSGLAEDGQAREFHQEDGVAQHDDTHLGEGGQRGQGNGQGCQGGMEGWIRQKQSC